MTNRKIAVAIGIIVAVVAILQWWIWPLPWRKPSTDPVGANTAAQLNARLAEAVAQALQDDNKIQVVPFVYTADIGSLIRNGNRNPDDEDACKPAPMPSYKPANLPFTSYDVDSGTVLSGALDKTLASELVSGGIDVKKGTNVVLTIEKPAMVYVTRNAFDKVVNDPGKSCKAELSRGTDYLVVRGYIRAKRTFRVTVSKAAGLKAGFQFGHFEISHKDGDGVVEISDQEPTDFLQLLAPTELVKQIASGRGPASESGPDGGAPAAAKIAKATTASTTRIFIQRDVADRTNRPQAVLDAMRVPQFVVIPIIEPIDSNKMPSTAQVRYANDTDEEAAKDALDRLKTLFPDAKLQKIRGSRSGQIEIWLPKAV